MHLRLLQRVLHGVTARPLHILEVAAGRADALRCALLRFRLPHAAVRVTLLDRSAQHLPVPAEWSAPLPRPELLPGDALSLPLPDKSVDVVSCCLFLHHLDEPQVQCFFREALRVARVAVLVNDLERRSLHYMLAWLFSLVDPSRLSRHDGPVSVRQAYTRAELEAMLHKNGYRFEVFGGYLFRLGIVVWESSSGCDAGTATASY